MMVRQHFFRPGMVEASAISGVEQACWDLLGKSLGVPVWRLLGGNVRDEVRLYDQHFMVEGKIGRLHGELFDVIASDLASWTARHNRWSDLEVDEVLHQDVRPGATVKPRKKAQRNIGALPKHLPRCEQVIEPETTACPCCQGLLHKIGQDVSEVLDVIPAILRVLRAARQSR